MATTAKRVKDARKPKFKSRQHNRCQLCGRPRAFLRKFGVCRLCFRSLALKGEIPGVVKSSWEDCASGETRPNGRTTSVIGGNRQRS